MDNKNFEIAIEKKALEVKKKANKKSKNTTAET